MSFAFLGLSGLVKACASHGNGSRSQRQVETETEKCLYNPLLVLYLSALYWPKKTHGHIIYFLPLAKNLINISYYYCYESNYHTCNEVVTNFSHWLSWDQDPRG